MVKTSVKFQMNRNKTVGGVTVAHTMYKLLYGCERTDIRTYEKDENYVYAPPLFFEKAFDRKKKSITKLIQSESYATLRNQTSLLAAGS